ncbi:unnamed protein product, partial [Urochloa humidicola]
HPKATGDAEAAPASCPSQCRPRLRSAPSSPQWADPAHGGRLGQVGATGLTEAIVRRAEAEVWRAGAQRGSRMPARTEAETGLVVPARRPRARPGSRRGATTAGATGSGAAGPSARIKQPGGGRAPALPRDLSSLPLSLCDFPFLYVVASFPVTWAVRSSFSMAGSRSLLPNRSHSRTNRAPSARD